MSSPDVALDFTATAERVAHLARQAVERDATSSIPNEALGTLLADLVALYAAKVQGGEKPAPFAGNSRPAVTDVAIVCTALMDTVGLELFELGGWQTMSGLGRLERPEPDTNAEL